MTQALALREQMAIDEVKSLVNIVMALKDEVFKKDIDFGVIPGTGDKPVLLLPGMEKLMRALHLRPEYVLLSSVEDFDKPLFFYRYECRLTDTETGVCLSTAIGSANSNESKWRWRTAKRICPNCGKDTINRSKYPPKNAPNAEPGWYCYAKAGGCGAEFAVNDPAIAEQQVGRVENPDIADQVNTIDKIAQKRALGSAIKGAANVSMLYTVDLEDFQPFDTGNVVQGNLVITKPEPEPRSADEPSAVVRGAGIEVVTRTWTEKEAVAWAATQRTQRSLTDSELLKALGVSRLGEWRGDAASATRRVATWLSEQLQQPEGAAEA